MDWFSFGILLFEMLCGINPIKNSKQESVAPEQVSSKIEEVLRSEDELLASHAGKFQPEAYDLLEKLLRYDPETRLGCREAGVEEIKQHPFFREIDWGLIERKGMTAPFVPVIEKGAQDVSNFDKTFTTMSMEDDESLPEHNLLKLQAAENVQLSNFTYVHEDLNQAMQSTNDGDEYDQVRAGSVQRTPKSRSSQELPTFGGQAIQ